MSFDYDFKNQMQNSNVFRPYTNIFDSAPDTTNEEKTIYWIQVRPFSAEYNGNKPYLIHAGSDYKIYPDALYLKTFYVKGIENKPKALEDRSVDIIAFEACGTIDNFWSKRGRYAQNHSSLLVKLNRSFCNSEIAFKNTKKPIYEFIHLGEDDNKDISLYARSLSIVYIIRDEDWDKIQYRICPYANEFFISKTDFSKDSTKIKYWLTQFDWKSKFFVG